MSIQERLRLLDPGLLKGIRRGIEKESLRVRPDGSLAATPHPAALGSALTHPNITTDFSESQLELITGVHVRVEDCLQELERIHQAVYRAIGDELLWCASMPCYLRGEETIPLGRYGSSNVGQAKTVYRNGLAHRYGKRMQMISGIHYNFSLPESAWGALGWTPDEGYFWLIRNFRRHAWLCFYLFGASPAVCSSFIEGRAHGLRPLGTGGTLHLPYATSLRMGRLGYQSDAQSSIHVSANSLEEYAHPIEQALTVPHPDYERIGIEKDGEYLQLSASLLQIENEFYGKIRPKRPIRPGERPLHALRERGVEYVEVRLMDLDPYAPVGITASTMRLLDVLLLHCLLSDSPPDTVAEVEAIAHNQELVAARGREPGLKLSRFGREVALLEWGGELLAECEPIARALDAAHGVKLYGEALSLAVTELEDASVPSARMLEEITARFGSSYPRLALAYSVEHRKTLLAQPFPEEQEARFAWLAKKSLEAQRKIEAVDTMPFEEYRQQYLDPSRLHAKRIS